MADVLFEHQTFIGNGYLAVGECSRKIQSASDVQYIRQAFDRIPRYLHVHIEVLSGKIVRMMRIRMFFEEFVVFQLR